MPQLNLQNVTLENETIVIDDAAGFHAIGAGAMLKNCELRISVPSRALSIRGTITGGLIHAKRELNGFDWLDARLDGVTFKGRFKNNRFGSFPPLHFDGTIAACDFSAAKLHDALFLTTRCEGVEFGKWPRFTIKNSREFHASVARLSESNSEADYLRFVAGYLRNYAEGAVALNFMTLDAATQCKRKGFDLEALRRVIDATAGITC